MSATNFSKVIIVTQAQKLSKDVIRIGDIVIKDENSLTREEKKQWLEDSLETVNKLQEFISDIKVIYLEM